MKCDNCQFNCDSFCEDFQESVQTAEAVCTRTVPAPVVGGNHRTRTLKGNCPYSCSGCFEEDQNNCLERGDAWFVEEPRTAVLLNHNLTEEQKLALGGAIYELPADLKKVWGQVPALGDADAVALHLAPIWAWLRTVAPDQVVAQGEFSATFLVRDWAKAKGLKFLVATSRRETVEVVTNGVAVKTAVFRHVQFREV